MKPVRFALCGPAIVISLNEIITLDKSLYHCLSSFQFRQGHEVIAIDYMHTSHFTFKVISG